MAGMKLKPVNPSVSPLPKPAANVPKIAKPAKTPKKNLKAALSPLYGQKMQRPVIQSTPTRVPSF